MSKTAIEWATHTENFFTGCDRVSPACANCYALTLAAKLQRWQQARIDKGQQHKPNRYATDGDPRTSGPGFGFTVHWDKLERPPRYPAGSRVFVQSMSDTFHEDAPVDALAALWRVFLEQPDVNWLVLTKRADRMRAILNDRSWWTLVGELHVDLARPRSEWHSDAVPIPRNVWCGVTVENRSAFHRIDDLRATPAVVRFISAEPLLGPLVAPMVPVEVAEVDGRVYPLSQVRGTVDSTWTEMRRDWDHGDDIDLTDIDWCIAGGESGPGRDSRKLVDIDAGNVPIERKLTWVRDLRDACLATGRACSRCHGFGWQDAEPDSCIAEDDCPVCRGTGREPGTGTAFFWKQWGGRTAKAGGRLLDGRTWDELPA